MAKAISDSHICTHGAGAKCKICYGAPPAPVAPVEVLKPCPMCGDTELDGGIYPSNRERTEFTLICGNPGCRCCIEAESVEEVRTRWNRRIA